MNDYSIAKSAAIFTVVSIAIYLAWDWISGRINTNPQGVASTPTNETGQTGSNVMAGSTQTASVTGATGLQWQTSRTIGLIGGAAQEVAAANPVNSKGRWLGGKMVDTFQPLSSNGGSIPTSNQNGEVSGSIQTASSRPYANGPNAAYMDAWNSSPTDPSYAVNGDPSLATVDTSSWDE